MTALGQKQFPSPLENVTVFGTIAYDRIALTTVIVVVHFWHFGGSGFSQMAAEL